MNKMCCGVELENGILPRAFKFGHAPPDFGPEHWVALTGSPICWMKPEDMQELVWRPADRVYYYDAACKALPFQADWHGREVFSWCERPGMDAVCVLDDTGELVMMT